MLSALKAFIIAAFLSVCALCLVVMVSFFGLALYEHFVPVSLAMVAFGLFVAAIWFLPPYFKERARAKRDAQRKAMYAPDYIEPTPGIVMSRYKSWKARICPAVEFE
jgi:Fe2+ transport system protein B